MVDDKYSSQFLLLKHRIFKFNIKAKGHEGHLHCSTQYKFKQQYMVADKSYLLLSNNR